MALTPARWLAIFVVGVCATIAAVIGMREATFGRFERWWLYRGRSGSSVQVAALSEAVQTLERRDSIVAALRRSPPTAGFSLVMGPPKSPSKDRALVDSAIRAFWRDYGPATARVPTVIVLTADSQRKYREIRIGQSAHVLTPAQTGGRACVIVIPWRGSDLPALRTWGDGERQTVAYGQLQRNAGPCVLLARYGAPGRAMRAWLDELNWFPARAVIRPRRTSLSFTPFGGVRSGTTAGVIGGYGWYGEPRFSVNGAGCLAGKDEMCERVWEQVAFRPYTMLYLPRGIVPAERWSTWGPLGDVSTYFVAELEAKLGAERFAKLWASDAPFDRAFTSASGKTMGMLAREVMEGGYRKLTNSPWPTLGEWAVSLLLLGASLGGLYLISGRRQAA